MAMKRCTKCAENIQWSALTCRFCGHDQPPPEGKEPMGRLQKGCLWIGGVILAFFALILFGPRDERVVAMQRCDEKVYVGGEEFYKLSPQERMKCMEPILNADPD